MDRLPTELLLEILSYLTPAQLLRVEGVCQRWKRVIQEQYWSRLKVISKETIGYPHENYLNNFIQLAARVVQVNRLVNPFLLMEETESHQLVEAELRKATLELVKKLSPDGLFPFDVIRSIVISKLKAKKKISEQDARSIILSEIDDAVKETQVDEFDSLLLNSMLVNSNERDPFVLRWGGEEVPLPVEAEKITRLVIGCLGIPIHFHPNCFEQAKKVVGYISNFTRLEFLEIESVQLTSLYHPVDEQPSEGLNLEFHRHRGQFTIAEFNSLMILFRVPRYYNDPQVAQYVKKWREEGRVKRASLLVSTIILRHMVPFFTYGHEQYVNSDSPSCIIPAEVILSHVDTLQIGYHDNENNILDVLVSCGVLSQLKELSFYFIRREESQAAWKVASIIWKIKDYLHNLKSLSLRFTKGIRYYPSKLFSINDVTVSNDPLPRLVSLDCIGLPCMPFIISVVSQAPNLHRLVIKSQPFVCYPMGLMWISKLLDAVHACPSLRFLHISVVSELELLDIAGIWSGNRLRSRLPKSIGNVKHLLSDIDRKLQAFRTKSSLLHVAVLLVGVNYNFVFSKENHFCYVN